MDRNMRSIWRFPIPVGAHKFTLEVPDQFEVLSVQNKDGDLNFWAILDPDSKRSKKNFYIIATGESFTTEFLGSNKYCGTFQVEGTPLGTLVFHLFMGY